MSPTARRNTALIISQVANPILTVLLGLGIIAYRYAESNREALEWTTSGFGLIAGPGLIYTIVTWLKSRRLDVDISNREDRIIPLLLSTMGAVFASFLISSRSPSSSLILISYVVVAMLISLTFITFVWKISFHSATLTAAVTLLVLFRGPEFGWLYLLLIPVIWSRLVLKQHTPAQLVAGTLGGVTITYLAFLLFRP